MQGTQKLVFAWPNIALLSEMETTEKARKWTVVVGVTKNWLV